MSLFYHLLSDQIICLTLIAVQSKIICFCCPLSSIQNTLITIRARDFCTGLPMELVLNASSNNIELPALSFCSNFARLMD
jgi:hypothetical protein